MDSTKLVSSDEELSVILNEAKGQLVIVNYFIESSSPCKKMEPIFAQMSFTFTAALFLKADADKCKKSLSQRGIQQMPSFELYRDMEPICTVEGAQPLELETQIRKNLKAEDQEFAGESGFSAGPGGQGDLYHYIDLSTCECLNASDTTPFQDFLGRKSKLNSDCDAQLILVIGFNQNVKLKTLKLKASSENGPTALKLFINQVATLDFDDAAAYTPAQEITMTKEDLNGDQEIWLRQAKFQDVRNLHIFIPANMSGSDITEIDHLSLFGEPLKRKTGIAGKTDQVVFIE